MRFRLDSNLHTWSNQFMTVYIVIAMNEDKYPDSVEVYGSQKQAEESAVAIARTEGFTCDFDKVTSFYFDVYGELMALNGTYFQYTGIYVKPRNLRRNKREKS